MNNNKKIKKPSMKNLVRAGKIWWEKINELYVKCIPYNIKEKVEEKPNEGDNMTNQQFDQIMKRMDDGFAEAKAEREEMKIEIKGMKVEIEVIKSDVDGIKKSLANLTKIVKKNHPKDFA